MKLDSAIVAIERH